MVYSLYIKYLIKLMGKLSLILFTLIILIITNLYIFKKKIKLLITKYIRKYLTITNDQQYILNKIKEPSFDNMNKLLEPILYYKNLSGKNMRKILTINIGDMFNINKNIIAVTYDFIDDLHNASLVIDDIQDNSLLRRNSKTSHLKYGIPMSIGASSLYIFKRIRNFYEKINSIINFDDLYEKHNYIISLEHLKMKINNMLNNKLLDIIYMMNIGQQMDVYWTYKKIIPTIDEYKQMIKNKTSKLFSIIIEIYNILSPNINSEKYEEYKTILENVGVFYQIRDDYINLCDKNYWKKKGFCEDFDEKKNSYIIIKYYNKINNKDQKDKFLKLFYKKDLTKNDKIKLLEMINETTIFDDTYEYLQELKINVEKVNLPMNKLEFKKFNMDDAIKF
jgi:geranylgeranyl diphosphate synthase, type III